MHHKKGKTLILLNLETGTIYHQRYEYNYINKLSSSKNDFVVCPFTLVLPLEGVLDAFGLEMSFRTQPKHRKETLHVNFMLSGIHPKVYK